MALIEPLAALVVSFCVLAVLIYKRVNLGVTLNVTALLLAFLVFDPQQVWEVLQTTVANAQTQSIVLASFGIMLLSMLYKETGTIDALSRSLSSIVKNSKLIVSAIPAVIGLLPVGGGALMSAPLVETEAEKLGLKEDKKTYVNLWFRHTIFPVYPINTVLIVIAGLTGLSVTSLIIRQIPVVAVMVIVGYLIGLRKTPTAPQKTPDKTDHLSETRQLAITFSPILATIVAVVILNIDVSIASFIGTAVLLMLARPKPATIVKPLRNWTIWGVTLAAFGAFLLKTTTETMGISQLFSTLISNGNVDSLLLLIAIPAFLSAITGSVSGGAAISIAMLAGLFSYTPTSVSLLYISGYFGYIVAPTHLCLVLTAEYFKCSLGRLYKYLIPSTIISLAAGILVFFIA
ncbi:MAG: DUF401 family protein [Candidatus Bathyarchaeota archaeon]|nr:DUF401 family protein [Candidatus Bathyarchaeota archaeon]